MLDVFGRNLYHDYSLTAAEAPVKAGRVRGQQAAVEAGKVTRAWITCSFFFAIVACWHACAPREIRQCCMEPTFTSDARLALVPMTAFGAYE